MFNFHATLVECNKFDITWWLLVWNLTCCKRRFLLILSVWFQVSESKIFERDGPNVSSTVTISFTQVRYLYCQTSGAIYLLLIMRKSSTCWQHCWFTFCRISDQNLTSCTPLIYECFITCWSLWYWKQRSFELQKICAIFQEIMSPSTSVLGIIMGLGTQQSYAMHARSSHENCRL